MSARPIGEIFAEVVVRAEAMMALQSLLNVSTESDGRKHLIMAAREAGAIGDDDATLLIQTYQLETA